MVKLHKDEIEKNHTALMAAASVSIRRDGIAATSVAEIATGVGLTHGAVYRRFPSKAALAAAVITQDFDKIVALLSGFFGREDGFAAYVKTYLDPMHRDHFPWGCPAAPLAAEIARVEPEVQQAFCAGVQRNLAAITGLDGATDEAKAMVALATMVGTMSLARACKASDPGLSDAFLTHARDALLQGHGGAKHDQAGKGG